MRPWGPSESSTSRNRLLAPALALALSVAAQACDRGPPPEAGGGEAGSPGVTVRDSGGVEIVENHAPEYPAGRFWTIDPEPEIVLGGEESLGTDADTAGAAADAAHLVWRVTGLARLADGRVAVLSGGNGQLHLFEPSGRLSKSIGRKGQGPGEFRRPEHLQYLPPDTLVVWDTWFGPIASFDTAGALLRHRLIDLGKVMARTAANAESPRYPLPDGSFVTVSTDEDPSSSHKTPPPGFHRLPPMELVRIDSTHTPHSFGSWAGWEFWILESGRPTIAFYLVDTHVAPGGRPSTIFIADGAKNEIRQFSPDGALLRIIRRATGPVPVTEKVRRAREEDFVRYHRDEGLDEDSARRDYGWKALNEMDLFFPPIGSLLADAEGYLWVMEWSAEASGETPGPWRGLVAPDQWSVFSPEGRWLGVVPAPPGFLCSNRGPPCWMGRDFFLGVKRDEMGIERVEGYRIDRRR